MMCIDVAAAINAPLEVRVATLLHDLGKAITPQAEWPSHRMHEARGVPLVEKFCARLRVPSDYRDLAALVTRDHLNVHRCEELRPQTLLELLERMQAFRKPDVFERALQSCLCDARGRKNFEESAHPQVPYLQDAARAARAVEAKDVVAAGFSGVKVGEELKMRRVAALKVWKEQYLAAR
jgi:tRNA nucleotidyltransferase (CCA-adding enzyme)